MRFLQRGLERRRRGGSQDDLHKEAEPEKGSRKKRQNLKRESEHELSELLTVMVTKKIKQKRLEYEKFYSE